MNKKTGWLSTVGGVVSSTIGILGATCVVCAPVCGTVCIAGPLAALTGIGIAGFLYKYNMVFIVIGGLLFLFGIFLIIKKRKTICECPAPEKTNVE